MSRYHAKKAVVYLSTTGSGGASLVRMAEWTLNRDTDKVEVTSFGDTNKTYVQGLPDITGTISGFWDDTDTKFFAATDSADGCKLYLYPSSDATGSYHYGPAWLAGNMSAPVNGAVSISGNFVANGAWGRVAI